MHAGIPPGGDPPGTRPPWEETHPGRRPPWTRHPPHQTRNPPGADPHPPAQSMLGDMVNARAVRILLECNLACLIRIKIILRVYEISVGLYSNNRLLYTILVNVTLFLLILTVLMTTDRYKVIFMTLEQTTNIFHENALLD